MQRPFHAEQRHLVNIGGISHGLGDIIHPGGHAIERAVRLDVIEHHAFGIQECPERADLVEQAVRQLFAGRSSFPCAKTLQIGQRRMGADLDAMPFGQGYGLAHVVEVGAVETAGDIGDVDQRHQALVVAHFVEAESLAHIAIDGHHFSIALVPAASANVSGQYTNRSRLTKCIVTAIFQRRSSQGSTCSLGNSPGCSPGNSAPAADPPCLLTEAIVHSETANRRRDMESALTTPAEPA
jgi:hypothetical protein